MEGGRTYPYVVLCFAGSTKMQLFDIKQTYRHWTYRINEGTRESHLSVQDLQSTAKLVESWMLQTSWIRKLESLFSLRRVEDPSIVTSGKMLSHTGG